MCYDGFVKTIFRWMSLALYVFNHSKSYNPKVAGSNLMVLYEHFYCAIYLNFMLGVLMNDNSTAADLLINVKT